MKYFFIFNLWLIIVTTATAQQTELKPLKQPLFKHTKYKDYSWGDYIITKSDYSPLRTKEAYDSCLVEQIIVECILKGNQTISDIKFSDNTPKFIRDRLILAINESAQYWLPKKKKGKYVDSKIVFAWGCVLMRGCTKNSEIDNIVYYKYNNFKYIDINKKKKYRKYDYIEQFHTIITP